MRVKLRELKRMIACELIKESKTKWFRMAPGIWKSHAPDPEERVEFDMWIEGHGQFPDDITIRKPKASVGPDVTEALIRSINNGDIKSAIMLVRVLDNAENFDIDVSRIVPKAFDHLGHDHLHWIVNRTRSPELLDVLSRSKRAIARDWVGRNDSASPQTLARLATDPDPKIRAGVAGNSNTSKKTLLRLLGDDSKDVQRAAAITLGAF